MHGLTLVRVEAGGAAEDLEDEAGEAGGVEEAGGVDEGGGVDEVGDEDWEVEQVNPMMNQVWRKSTPETQQMLVLQLSIHQNNPVHSYLVVLRVNVLLTTSFCFLATI